MEGGHAGPCCNIRTSSGRPAVFLGIPLFERHSAAAGWKKLPAVVQKRQASFRSTKHFK
jgi:hypothetical protein